MQPPSRPSAPRQSKSQFLGHFGDLEVGVVDLVVLDRVG